MATAPYNVDRAKVDHPSYTAYCRICDYTSAYWDYRRNALSNVRTHIQKEHPEVKL